MARQLTADEIQEALARMADLGLLDSEQETSPLTTEEIAAELGLDLDA